MTIVAGNTALASDFVSTSAGAGDSGKVPKLGATGKIDESFIPVPYVKTSVFSSGLITRSASGANATVNVAHGLGVIPKKVKFSGTCINANDTGTMLGVYDASGQRMTGILDREGGSSASASIGWTDTTHALALYGDTVDPGAGGSRSERSVPGRLIPSGRQWWEDVCP